MCDNAGNGPVNDCTGLCNGTAVVDACDVCNGNGICATSTGGNAITVNNSYVARTCAASLLPRH